MSIKTLFLALLFILSLEANERIISLSPSITEIVYALGIGENLVGTSEYSLYPNEAQKVPIVGGSNNPNIEKIIFLSPTLVVGQTFSIDTLEKLKKFHIKSLMLNLQTIENIKSSILKLSKETNTFPHAKVLVQKIDNALQEAPKSKNPHAVLIVFGLHEDLRSGIYVAGNEIFFNDIILACGNTNAYSDKTTEQPVLSYENIIALNPDQIIILHSHATEANVDVQKALQAWYKLPTNASKNGKISIVDEDYLHIASHRVALTIERLCKEMNK
ncbi:MAG: helical backbone metal receptor [Sulfurimonas sp.]|jgi:iron complex transport system substrate-binding protein